MHPRFDRAGRVRFVRPKPQRSAIGDRDRRRHRAAAHAMALCLSFGILPAAQAQPASPQVPATIDEGLRRQAERERAQQEAATPRVDNLRPTARDATARPELPDERPCFVIHEIALTGPDVQRLDWLTGATVPFLNRCIGAQGLSRIAAHLDALLIEQGYVTSRVSFGPQNLAAGRVELRLHGGRIAQVRMVDADRPDKPADERWGTWRNAFPTRAGALLDARDLEQGVEQMKRLPSQDVTTTLAPGDAPDTSILTIERHAGGWGERLRGGITLDNSGGPSLGRTQAGASLALDNPLGLNDLLGLSLNSNAEQPRADHRSQGFSLNYGIPFGYGTLGISASRSRFAQIVQLPTLPHLSSGESQSAGIDLRHIAWRSASSKLELHAGLSVRRSRSFLDDTELLTQNRRTTFFETGASLRQVRSNNASLGLGLSYRRGVSWLGAQDDLPADPLDPAAVPTLRPRLWTLEADLSIPFEQPALGDGAARPWKYSASLKLQTTGEHMLSIDQIAIGGRATVRGFDGDSVLIAENGWFLRNELSTPLRIDGVEAAFYAGLDLGRVWGPSDALLPGHGLAGAALGVRARFKAVQLDLAVATPLAMPEGFRTGRLNVYASGAWSF